MGKYTNVNNIPLSLAVWLATDDYDHDDTPNTISATTLLKPIKELILATRLPPQTELPVDIASRISAQMGAAIHAAIDKAWQVNYGQAMKDLGYPDKIINKIAINPKEVNEDIIPIYMEQRLSKKFGKWTITGKFDFLPQGRVTDFKCTGTYTYVKKVSDKKYIQQGSIYRWLDPSIITDDIMDIHFIFWDWKEFEYMQNKASYPPSKLLKYPLRLMSISSTEDFITDKLAAIEQYYDSDESDIPMCTPEDLWQDAPNFKYYKNPANTARSTKNYDTLLEANQRLATDGNVGMVVTNHGQVKACKYCAVASICKQKDTYIANGSLKL